MIDSGKHSSLFEYYNNDCRIKYFSTSCCNKVFVPVKHYQVSLMFVGKAGGYPNEGSNNRLHREGLPLKKDWSLLQTHKLRTEKVL
jgi:hypothetical protein